jgi:hypothetical protein
MSDNTVRGRGSGQGKGKTPLNIIESEELRRTLSTWKPSVFHRATLFQGLSSIRGPEQVLTRAFQDPGLSAAVVESLSVQPMWSQAVAASTLGGGVALDAARPLVRVEVPPALANVGQQLAVVSESLSRLAKPRSTVSWRGVVRG